MDCRGSCCVHNECTLDISDDLYDEDDSESEDHSHGHDEDDEYDEHDDDDYDYDEDDDIGSYEGYDEIDQNTYQSAQNRRSKFSFIVSFDKYSLSKEDIGTYMQFIRSFSISV